MNKKTKFWGYVVILVILTVIVYSLFLIKRNIEKKEKQNANIELKVQKLDCGESFMVSEITHYWAINAFEKSVKISYEEKDSVILGHTMYKVMGQSYNWDGKCIWELKKNDSSYLEILIEEKPLGSETFNFMTVRLVCVKQIPGKGKYWYILPIV